MDDNDKKENPSSDFNKLDLTQLQSFSFGTQWTQDKPSAGDQREPRERSDRPRRDDRRSGPNDPRRDRRGFRKPAPAPGEGPAPVEDRPQREGGGGGPRREFRGGPRPEGAGQFRGPRGAGRGEPQERGPYDSPYFAATFYPEDNSFNALAKTIRASCRTIELFEIARTVIGKNDRFVVVLTRKPAKDGGAKEPIYLSVPDGVPFDSEEAAINHVMSRHLDKFFASADIEIDPPKGNFQVINKCGITGALLGPPNYHRYNQLVQQHFATQIQRMPFETFRARIETVRDPEAVSQWLEQMKKVTRYTWLTGAAASASGKVEKTDPAPADAGEADATATETQAEAPADTPAETPAATPDVPSFDSIEEARLHLLTTAREKVVRTVETARFHGNMIEQIPDGEIRRAIEGTLERQRRFPLDTANGLRGRLRREHFTIFKKGSKGVSYVCAVKRKFRTPGQTFADSIDGLINFIEAHPMIKASELTPKFLGIKQPAAEPAPAAEGSTPEAAPPAPELTVEQRANIARMQGDLRWLVMEGYVTEFIDGRLFAAPPMVEARKREVDAEENDPENYPDAPAETPAPPENKPAVAPAAAAPESQVGAVAADTAVTPVEAQPEPTESQPPAEDEEHRQPHTD